MDYDFTLIGSRCYMDVMLAFSSSFSEFLGDAHFEY